MNTDFTNVTKVIHNGHDIKKVYQGNTLEWEHTPVMTTGLKIVNESNETNTFTITKTGSPNAVTLDYALESASSISQWSSSSGNLSVNIPVGDVLVIRSHSSNNFTKDSSNYYRINCTKNYSIEGKITYLLNSTGNVTTIPENAFRYLFKGSPIINARKASLPSTSVNSGGYYQMFMNCTSLTGAPEIFATSFPTNDSNLMQMFYDCDSLNYIKVHFTTWTSVITNQWTALIANTSGTFVKPSALSNTKNSSGNPTPTTSGQRTSYQIPYKWTVQSY